ncbi:hypothetical protein [Alkalicoccobacillus gibsonii]|uniref:hypothetical protein n=1 Tax=Alkalicoccobacillus gibsonii TaxID=79881 RepID=UPI00193390AA|nr:hypothetical protein [Alkalicoccobacillus gibsonii]MBM0066040.1 hypothetical protein [Alkalicoccobacillus gibsonii]
MKKINLIARLLFILGIVSLCIGGVIGLIFTYHWMNIGAIVQFFGSYLFVLLSIAFIFLLIGFILFGISEMIEQQTLTNQLLAKHEKINLTHFHEKLISEHQPTPQPKESTVGFHFPDSDAPPLHHSIRTKRLMNVDWYTADSDPHWISHMVDKLGEKVHTITALPQSDWYAATTSSNTHLVKIDRDRTNEAVRFEWTDYPDLSEWWNTYQAKQSDNK